ncbi:hypothetical protein DCC84_10150 [Pseudomonas sp. SXM-1]|nr:hypothetical protein DCC84_10150 [Pseudomonas sp. SXM-1]
MGLPGPDFWRYVISHATTPWIQCSQQLTAGASLLAKNSRAPCSFRMLALSLTTFASKLAPTGSFGPVGPYSSRHPVP